MLWTRTPESDKPIHMALSKNVMASLIALLFGVTPAAADVVFFSNLGPGDSFETTRATFFGFDQGEEGDPDIHFARAMPFLAGSTGTLRTIEVALEFPFSFDEGTLAVNLFAANGDLPGSLLEAFTSSEPKTGRGLFSFSSEVQPKLTSGSLYFLEATTVGMADGLWWFALGPSASHLDIYRFDNGSWQTGLRDFTAAFRVSGRATVWPRHCAAWSGSSTASHARQTPALKGRAR